jgi:hypothetical protein
MIKRLLPLFIVLFLFAPLAAGCSSQTAASVGHAYRLAPLHEMPSEVQKSPQTVREAYQFAVAHPEVVQALPCYCGCGPMGHVSNESCYIEARREDGIVYDNHALGCQICVDITQDARRLLDDGKGIDDIYAYVDATYSRFGPPTPLQ